MLQAQALESHRTSSKLIYLSELLVAAPLGNGVIPPQPQEVDEEEMKV